MRNLALFFLILCSSCATPGYVLHWRASGSDEVAPTAASGGVALLYDRARWVVFEREADDGSVTVQYQLIVKNAGEQPVNLTPGKIRLIAKGGTEIPAVFLLRDLETARKPLPPATSLLVACKFHLAHAASLGGDSLELVVPVEGKGELRQKVWLWKE